MTYVNTNGTCLATRWQDELPVLLYHLPGHVLVGLTYDTGSNAVIRVQPFVSGKPLAAYAPGITLPKI